MADDKSGASKDPQPTYQDAKQITTDKDGRMSSGGPKRAELELEAG